MKKITPIFIFSLPRSGSTLLQRMLSSSPKISTADEPWILLPLASMKSQENLRVFANYSHWHVNLAISEFIQTFPENEVSFYTAIQHFVTELYALSSGEGNAVFFLDKTPRYYLIIDFIAQVFPDAKFIFLFRNPLDVLSSIIDTWGGNKLHITHWAVDLYQGPQCLLAGYRKYNQRSILVRYEDLVSSSAENLKDVCDFLEVEFSSSMLDGWKKKSNASMGDFKINSKSAVDISSIGKWKETLNTHIRRAFALWYVSFLGEDILGVFGFDKLALQKELKTLPCSWKNTFSDGFDIITSMLGRFFPWKVLKNQIKKGVWKAELFA